MKRKQRENNHANSCPLKEQQPRSLYRYCVQLAPHFESPHFGEPRFYMWAPRQEVQK